LDDILQRASNTLSTTAIMVVEKLPLLLLALVIALLGWLLAKGLGWGVKRLSLVARTESFTRRTGLDQLLAQLHVHSIADLLGRLVYWAVMLATLMLVADTLSLHTLTQGVRSIFAYMPSLFASLAVFVFGFWLADKARFVMGAVGTSMGMEAGKTIGRIMFAVILMFISITALNVAGIDTSLITSNILIVVASLFISFSIAYGFAARDILSNILAGYYNKERLQPGQRVRIGNDEGVVERVSGISVVIRSGDRTIHIPSTRLVTERVELLEVDSDDTLAGTGRTAVSKDADQN
jgi:hypothetical protein